MIDTEIYAQLARALGRPLDGPGERRLALIIGAVLVVAEPQTDLALAAACDLYARLMAAGRMPACPLLRPPRAGG